jgi:steroid delta-isomerase-like uncharacterized protein
MGAVRWHYDQAYLAKGISMTLTAREAFDKSTEAFNSHDIDGFADTLADDVVFRAPGGTAGEGKAACAQYFGGWLDAFPDAHVEIHDLHIAGDVAVEEGEFTGTQHGVLRSSAGDVPATGRSVTADYVMVLRFRDGKFVSLNLRYDRLLLLEQLGVIPAQQPAG